MILAVEDSIGGAVQKMIECGHCGACRTFDPAGVEAYVIPGRLAGAFGIKLCSRVPDRATRVRTMAHDM